MLPRLKVFGACEGMGTLGYIMCPGWIYTVEGHILEQRKHKEEMGVITSHYCVTFTSKQASTHRSPISQT